MKRDNVVQILPPTEEEMYIVSLLSGGEKGNNVAAELGLNESSLAAKLSDLRYKYRAKNSTELVAIFLRNGFIK